MDELRLRRLGSGWNIEGRRYTVRWRESDPARLRLEVEQQWMASVPVLSGLDTTEAREELTNLRGGEPVESAEGITLSFTADSNRWSERRFCWRFETEGFDYYHEAKGEGALGRCCFLGHAAPACLYDSWIQAPDLYSPQQNFAARNRYQSGEPARVHVTDEHPLTNKAPVFIDYPYFPPPLFVAFGHERSRTWLGVGLAAERGKANYNGLTWTGDRNRGTGCFEVEYLGYQRVEGHYRSPVLGFHPGYDPHEAMRQHVRRLETHNAATARAFPNADWHRRPLFCGWAEQTGIAGLRGEHPGGYANQAFYEKTLARLDELGLPAGTIVIDDKWMKHYGRWDVDEEKWPDLPGFIRHQHERGRRVLLWFSCWHAEGLPPEWCVREITGETERVLQADVSLPAYQEFVRERVRDLIGPIGADGFKMDWIFSLPKKPGLAMHAPLWGLDRLHTFQKLVYDAAHEVKPDALVQTQTPHPLFRDCSDMIRLNDLGFSMRNVVDAMRERARVARIAGWELLDCDNASSTGLEEWRRFMREQPNLGVPSLYCLSVMESTFEPIPEGEWPAIRVLWEEYLEREFGEIGDTHG